MCAQVMMLYEDDGSVSYVFEVGTGRKNFSTPEMTWVPMAKVRMGLFPPGKGMEPLGYCLSVTYLTHGRR
jgi:hypothetical protein